MEMIGSLLLNIVGGVLAGVALIILQVVYRYSVARRFTSFFGIREDRAYHIVYTLYNVAPRTTFPLPESHVARRSSGLATNLEQVISGATVKAVAYLVGAFAEGAKFMRAFTKETRLSPAISSHTDVDESMGISFISIGLRTNFKTLDVLDNPANRFVDCVGYPAKIIQKSSQSTMADADSLGECDYGLIVKIHPDEDKTRTWICCGGFGIVATGGAAFYLARKWREIRKWTGDEPFACLVETTRRGDESTRVTKIFVERLRGLAKLRKWLRRDHGTFEIVELMGSRRGR